MTGGEVCVAGGDGGSTFTATDSTRVLKAEGFDVPEGITVRLLFNTDRHLHIVLPAPLD